MFLKNSTCPNCGANYNPAEYKCKYCGSYIFLSSGNFDDFSNFKIDLKEETVDDSKQYPGVYVYGRLLGKGEKPILLGLANYFTAGGKLLLTNKSLIIIHNYNFTFNNITKFLTLMRIIMECF